MNYSVLVYPEKYKEGDMDWVARFPGVVALKHCIGVGSTPEEALKEAFKNLDLTISSLKKNGEPLPEPAVFAMKTVSVPMFAVPGSTDFV